MVNIVSLAHPRRTPADTVASTWRRRLIYLQADKNHISAVFKQTRRDSLKREQLQESDRQNETNIKTDKHTRGQARMGRHEMSQGVG